MPGIYSRMTIDEAPNIGVERPEFVFRFEECLCVLNGGFDLQPVANDSGISQKSSHLSPIVLGDHLSVELIERCAIVLAFAENRVPAQARLCAFKNEKFEQPAI